MIVTRLLAFIWCFPLLVLVASPHVGATEAVAHADSVIRVGPVHVIKSISQAARLAHDGSIVEVDAGDYVGDVAVWTQNQLTLKAVGGRVRLVANGSAAEGKAIWVVRGGAISIDGFDFIGTKVADRNGAGIRLEAGKLRVSNCTFIGNENGILTSNNARVELDIVDSEFGHNGYGDGYSHNLYAGAIARLSVTGSYFHHANVGHLIKSRAALSDIRYNRLADGPGGRASYELEFANGGVAYVVGNIIEQGELTENPHLISYAAEGYRWPSNALYLVHNTLMDRKSAGGIFLSFKQGDATLKAVNNLLAGPGGLERAGPGDFRNNVSVPWDVFDAHAPEYYRLRRDAVLAGKVVDSGSADGVPLQPVSEYRVPVGTIALARGTPLKPGAMQTSATLN
jgi:hypothetical protein